MSPSAESTGSVVDVVSGGTVVVVELVVVDDVVEVDDVVDVVDGVVVLEEVAGSRTMVVVVLDEVDALTAGTVVGVGSGLRVADVSAPSRGQVQVSPSPTR